jgi:thiol-disulfide isomerase/thioredoxin
MTKWIVAALLFLSGTQETQNLGNSYLGKAPPELSNAGAKWLNSDALTLEKLKGKPVWIEFGFLKCPPCRKFKPNLVRWHKDFAAKGLVVIDVSDGSQDDYDHLKKDVEEKGEKFPVLWDKDAAVCLAYGIQAYPQAYLVGVDGKVIWEGSPNAKIVEAVEKLMAAEFEKVKK